MSFFSKLSGGADNLQKEYLGETYEYHKNINSPGELGMSSQGSLGALAKNVAGIVNYTDVLITGQGRASKTGKPLGNKFFLATGGKCEPSGYVKSNGKLVKTKGGNETTRYLYINNQPDGKVPFLPIAGDFRGMIPGVIGNLGALNPVEIMGGFVEGSKPPCYKVSFPTIDAKNRRGSASHYITETDLKNMSGCNFPGGYNPITKQRTSGCKQGFDIMQKYINKEKDNQSMPKMSKNPAVKMYTAGFGILMIYLLFKMFKKN